MRSHAHIVSELSANAQLVNRRGFADKTLVPMARQVTASNRTTIDIGRSVGRVYGKRSNRRREINLGLISMVLRVILAADRWRQNVLSSGQAATAARSADRPLPWCPGQFGSGRRWRPDAGARFFGRS